MSSAGTIFYLNRTHRWNWGLSLDQTPYVQRGFQAGVVGNTYVEQEYRYLQRDQSADRLPRPIPSAGRGAWSSPAAIRRIGQSYDLTERTYDLSGEQLTEEQRRRLRPFRR